MTHSRKWLSWALARTWSSANPCSFPGSMLPFPLLIGNLVPAKDSNPEGLRPLYPTPRNFLLKHFLLPWSPIQAPSSPQHVSASLGWLRQRPLHGMMLPPGICEGYSSHGGKYRQESENPLPTASPHSSVYLSSSSVTGSVLGALPALISFNSHFSAQELLPVHVVGVQEIHVTKRSILYDSTYIGP